jgi:N-acetylmuramate 1-kinase
MSSRPLEIASFLEQHGWDHAEMQALNADFSTRRYARLSKGTGKTAFLMDADQDQKTPQFVGVAKILRGIDIKAPEIYAADSEHGLVLMEDFGSRNVGALLDAGESPLPYFLRAADVLTKLHRSFDPSAAQNLGLPLFDAALFTTQAELFLDAYFPVIMQREASEEERGDFRAAWQVVLRPIDDMPKTLMLRDFMPDNLMDLSRTPNKTLPLDGGGLGGGDSKTRNQACSCSTITPIPAFPHQGGRGSEELGVLDFQDAGIGPIAYDLASLCEEVRRDGGFALLPQVIDRYLAATQSPVSAPDLLRACTVLSAQRHTRILGIIARLSVQTGQCDKFAFLPRIRHHLETLLEEPALLPVREWVETFDRLLQ